MIKRDQKVRRVMMGKEKSLKETTTIRIINREKDYDVDARYMLIYMIMSKYKTNRHKIERMIIFLCKPLANNQ